MLNYGIGTVEMMNEYDSNFKGVVVICEMTQSDIDILIRDLKKDGCLRSEYYTFTGRKAVSLDEDGNVIKEYLEIYLPIADCEKGTLPFNCPRYVLFKKTETP